MKKERTLFTMCRKKCLSFILSFCALIIYSATVYSQVNISGIVKDSNNEPLIGVNVIVKGTQQGTVTNTEGEFTLTAPNTNAVIEFSYIGFQTQELSLNGQTYLNVIMRED